MEGICIDLLKVVLEHHLDNKYFDFIYLNSTIKNFPYIGRDLRNKPGLLNIKGSKIVVKQN